MSGKRSQLEVLGLANCNAGNETTRTNRAIFPVRRWAIEKQGRPDFQPQVAARDFNGLGSRSAGRLVF